MDSLEQKIRDSLDRFGEGVFRNKAYLNMREDVLAEILALLQQPEGGLVGCPPGENIDGICSHRLVCRAAKEAQLALDRVTMVKISWLYESCPHSEPMTQTARRECDECMEGLLSLPKK